MNIIAACPCGASLRFEDVKAGTAESVMVEGRVAAFQIAHFPHRASALDNERYVNPHEEPGCAGPPINHF